MPNPNYPGFVPSNKTGPFQVSFLDLVGQFYGENTAKELGAARQHNQQYNASAGLSDKPDHPFGFSTVNRLQDDEYTNKPQSVTPSVDRKSVV